MKKIKQALTLSMGYVIRLFLLCCFGLVSFDAFCQEKNLKVHLHFAADEFFLLDPLQWWFTLENVGEKSETILPISAIDNKLMYGIAHLEYHAHNPAHWDRYADIRSWGFEMAGFLDEKSMQLKPEEMLHSEKMTILSGLKAKPSQQRQNSIYENGTLLIKKPGNYHFRLVYSIYRPFIGRWDTLVSQPVVLAIKNYEKKEDKNAYRFLAESPNPNFLSVYQTARYIGTFRDSVLYAYAQHITEKFPRSQFAPWAYVFLADMNRLNIKEITSELDKEHNLAALRSIKLYYDKSRVYNVPAVNYVSSSIYYTIYQYLTEVLMFDENEMKTNPIAKEFIEEK